MNLKRIMLVLVLVLSMFAFVGCGSDDSNGDVKGVTDENGMYDNGNGTVNNDDSLKDDLNDVKRDAEDMMDMNGNDNNVNNGNTNDVNNGNTTDSGMNY